MPLPRAILEHVVSDPSGDIQTTQVYVYEPDGSTLLGQTMWSAPSGGVALTNPLQPNNVGFVKAYADVPQTVIAKVGAIPYPTAFVPSSENLPLRDHLPINAMALPHLLQGDGSDETVELQAFFDSMSSNGAYELPVGTYRTTAMLTLSAPLQNVHIRGYPGTVIQQTTAGQGGLRVTNATNVTIDNVNFQGPGTAGDTAMAAHSEIGIYVVAGSTVVIRDCTVTGFGWKGIQCDSSSTTVSHCVVTGTGQTVQGEGSGITIFGGKSELLFNRVDNYANGLAVQSNERSSVIGNWVNQTTPPAYINTGSYANAPYLIFSANHLHGSSKISFTTNHSVCSGNVWTARFAAGVYYGGGGITLTHSSGGICSDNTIDGGSILLTIDEDAGNRPYGLRVSGNHIRRAPVATAAPGVFTGAITMGNPCRNCVIENNIIEYPYGHGIIGYDSGSSGSSTRGFENLTIRHNTIRRSTTTGGYSAIKLGYGYGESLAGLRIYGNTVESLPSDTSGGAISVTGSNTITLSTVNECEKFTPGDYLTGLGITPGTWITQLSVTNRTLMLSAPVPSGGTTGVLTRAPMRFIYAVDLLGANNSSASAIEIRDDNAWGAASTYTTGIIAYQIGVIRRDSYRYHHSMGGTGHNFTGLTDFDTYAQMEGLSPTDGGGLISGFSKQKVALQVNANVTVEDGTRNATTASAPIVLAAWQPNSTSSKALDADTNILAVRSGGTNLYFLDSDGNSFQHVGTAWTTFDDHDDIGLLNTLAAHVARPGDAIADDFRQFITYHRERLSEVGLVNFNDDGSIFVNMSRLTMLLVGAVRWLGLESSNLRGRLDRIEQQLALPSASPEGA